MLKMFMTGLVVSFASLSAFATPLDGLSCDGKDENGAVSLKQVGSSAFFQLVSSTEELAFRILDVKMVENKLQATLAAQSEEEGLTSWSEADFNYDPFVTTLAVVSSKVDQDGVTVQRSEKVYKLSCGFLK